MIKRCIIWFKENVLGIKPIFKIKIVKSWFSEKYYAIKFSDDNGWSWRYLQEEGWDLSSHCDELECRVAYFSSEELKNIAPTLISYEACDEYNRKVREKIETVNRECRREYYKQINCGDEFMESFNKEHK